jgi:hypothetical protein
VKYGPLARVYLIFEWSDRNGICNVVDCDIDYNRVMSNWIAKRNFDYQDVKTEDVKNNSTIYQI